MAKPFRIKTTTYTLPDGSHRTPDGKRVTSKTPGAIKQPPRVSELYYGNYRDADGILQRRVPLCPNFSAAKQMLAKLITDAKLGTVNLTSAFEKHHKRPLLEHVEDYRLSLEADGNCPEYVASACGRVRTVISGCAFTFTPDMRPEKVAEYLHGLRRDPPRPSLPVGQELFTPKELVEALDGCRPPRLARLLRREGLATVGPVLDSPRGFSEPGRKEPVLSRHQIAAEWPVR